LKDIICCIAESPYNITTAPKDTTFIHFLSIRAQESFKNMMTVRLSSLAVLFIFLLCHFCVQAFTSPSNLPQQASMVLASSVHAEQQRKEWIDKNILDSEEYQEDFHLLAKKHYFALRKIKNGQYRHAELIYRRIIDAIMHEEEGHCDHAKLAVTTLLLALHLQRMGDFKKTRSVFLMFFRIVVVESENDDTECACSAKVLGAYALFEMKQGNRAKSLEIARKAVQFDQSLEPVLQWKQFRDADERRRTNRS
jgi:tetratricopeptide (TPR) repeat protein